jgi:proline iminopeptidase
VTHHWANAAFLPDGALLAGADRLVGIPGVVVHGRLDISGPPDIAWHVAQRWTELVVVDGVGHSGSDPTMVEAVLAATDRFASRH